MLRELPCRSAEPAVAAHGNLMLDGVAADAGRPPVLRRVKLNVRGGEAVGLLGLNGCSNSILLPGLATLRSPTAARGHVVGAA